MQMDGQRSHDLEFPPGDMMTSISRRSFLLAGVGSTFSLPRLAAAVDAYVPTSRRPKLKITDVRTAMVRAHGHQLHVRIYSDQGLVGHGEATDAVAGGQAIVRSFRQRLVGQDPLNVDFLFESLRTGGIFAGAQAGQYVAALSGVEIALWDLAGKALELPVYQLLGGKMRDRIRMYCDLQAALPASPDAEQQLQSIHDMGFTAAKIDIDDPSDPMRRDQVNWTASNAEIDNMVKKVAFARQCLRDRVDLAVDMHGRYDMTTAKRVAVQLEPFRLLFLEEPVPAENVDALRDVRQSTTTPICCGENLFLRTLRKVQSASKRCRLSSPAGSVELSLPFCH